MVIIMLNSKIDLIAFYLHLMMYEKNLYYIFNENNVVRQRWKYYFIINAFEIVIKIFHTRCGSPNMSLCEDGGHRTATHPHHHTHTHPPRYIYI